MAKKDAIDRSLNELFSAERQVRSIHDALAENAPEVLLEALVRAINTAIAQDDEDEASLRLVRIAALLSEIEGPKAMDALIDVLATDLPEARHAAGEEIEARAFERTGHGTRSGRRRSLLHRTRRRGRGAIERG